MAVRCLETKRLLAMLAYEKKALKEGYKVVCGIDEAGRGPLAGPVVAAACILPADVFKKPLIFRYLNDSKMLSPDIRLELFHLITNYPGVIYGVGESCHAEIDRVNILQATILAMQRSVSKLLCIPDLLLVDGLKLPMETIPVQKIIKGDQLSLSVAAGAIIAKVTRDLQMEAYDEQHPEYGFKQHKGYGTAKHLAALQEHGPCPIHRLTFAPVANSIK